MLRRIFSAYRSDYSLLDERTIFIDHLFLTVNQAYERSLLNKFLEHFDHDLNQGGWRTTWKRLIIEKNSLDPFLSCNILLYFLAIAIDPEIDAGKKGSLLDETFAKLTKDEKKELSCRFSCSKEAKKFAIYFLPFAGEPIWKKLVLSDMVHCVSLIKETYYNQDLTLDAKNMLNDQIIQKVESQGELNKFFRILFSELPNNEHLVFEELFSKYSDTIVKLKTEATEKREKACSELNELLMHCENSSGAHRINHELRDKRRDFIGLDDYSRSLLKNFYKIDQKKWPFLFVALSDQFYEFFHPNQDPYFEIYSAKQVLKRDLNEWIEILTQVIVNYKPTEIKYLRIGCYDEINELINAQKLLKPILKKITETVSDEQCIPTINRFGYYFLYRRQEKHREKFLKTLSKVLKEKENKNELIERYLFHQLTDQSKFRWHGECTYAGEDAYTYGSLNLDNILWKKPFLNTKECAKIAINLLNQTQIQFICLIVMHKAPLDHILKCIKKCYPNELPVLYGVLIHYILCLSNDDVTKHQLIVNFSYEFNKLGFDFKTFLQSQEGKACFVDLSKFYKELTPVTVPSNEEQHVFLKLLKLVNRKLFYTTIFYLLNEAVDSQSCYSIDVQITALMNLLSKRKMMKKLNENRNEVLMNKFNDFLRDKTITIQTSKKLYPSLFKILDLNKETVKKNTVSLSDKNFELI
jgi:hypothetical protein